MTDTGSDPRPGSPAGLFGPDSQFHRFFDDPRWAPHVADFRAAAQASASAAAAKDFGAMEQDAEKIDRACVACHRTFVPQIELPDPPAAASASR